MSKPPFAISYKDHQALRNILGSDQGYSPAKVAREWKLLYGNNPDTVGGFNTLAVYAMSLGHIALAEALVSQGADPRSSDVTEFNLGFFIWGYRHPSENPEEYSIPHLLARQMGKLIPAAAAPASQLRRPRVEVLRHLQAHPGAWNIDIHQIKDGSTPLVAALGTGNRFSRWGSATNRTDNAELEQFMQGLIAMGADINPPCKNNLLEAAIPDYNANENPDFQWLDRVISWGVDTKRFAPHAWARALGEDVDRRHYTKKAPLGPRAQALAERGIELSSPSNLPEKFSPLAQAFQTKMVPILQRLVQEGVDPCWTAPRSNTTLLTLAATRRGNLAAMLDHFPIGSFKDVVNLANADGETALHLAVNALDLKLVKRLLDEGADVNAQNKKKQKPIQSMRRSAVSVQHKFDDLAELLMAHGGDMGADKRNSALHQAAKMHSVKMITKLLADGADPHMKNKSGDTPVGAVLMSHQRSVGSYFDRVRGNNQVKALRAFHDAGVDINKTLPDGSSLLYHAMERCCGLAALELIALGADINAPGRDGRLPMHAWNEGYYANDKVFKNPKHQATILAVIEAFIEAGADMDQPDAKGRLPFHPARDNGGVIATLERGALERATAASVDTDEQPPARRLRL